MSAVAMAIQLVAAATVDKPFSLRVTIISQHFGPTNYTAGSATLFMHQDERRERRGEGRKERNVLAKHAVVAHNLLPTISLRQMKEQVAEKVNVAGFCSIDFHFVDFHSKCDIVIRVRVSRYKIPFYFLPFPLFLLFYFILFCSVPFYPIRF